MKLLKKLKKEWAVKEDGKSGLESEARPLPEDVTKEEILAMLERERVKRSSERRPFELQWTLNSNFLAGHQYCGINTASGEITGDENGRGERGVYNRISPIMDTRLANLRQIKYSMTVRARTNEPDDWEKAYVSTKLLRYISASTDFDARRSMLLSWCELCGSAFVMSWWNKYGGKETLIAEGEGKKSLTLCEGELAYGLLTPYEVYPESVYKQDMDDQNSILLEQVMTAEEVNGLYGTELKGEPVDTWALTPAGGRGTGLLSSAFAMTSRLAENSVRLLTWFERPCAKYPDGRLIIAAQNEILYYGPLPDGVIPIISVKSKDVPGLFFGRSVIQELIPLQRAYNGCKNKIHDHIKTLASNPLLVPEGSVEDMDALLDIGITPGSIIEYNPERGAPAPIQVPPISDEVRLECESLAREMEYIAGVSQLMVTGSTPSGITSGIAINRLQQIDGTRLSLSGDNYREAIKRLAALWLKILKNHVTGSRAVFMTGDNDSASVLTWSAEDINSYDVEFDTENELKYTEEKQRENFREALEMGLFTGEDGKLPPAFRQRALEMMKMGSYSSIMGENELQLQNARRENSLLESGLLPEVGPYDDHCLHLEEHRRFALQNRFSVLRKTRPELAGAFDGHIKEHAEKIIGIAGKGRD